MTPLAPTTHMPSPAEDFHPVTVAIRFLESQSPRQPSLREIADAVGLSEFHMQRLFTRWAGISPKQFSRYLTVEHARRLLRESASVMDAAYEVGLSGPGRLHDLMVTFDAVTPGEYRRAGAGMTIDCGVHDCPFGRVLLATTQRGVCGLFFVDDEDGTRARAELQRHWPRAELRERPAATAQIARRVFRRRDHRRAARDAAPLHLLVRGTNFQVKVWEALLRIPLGRLVSYQDVARAIGRPSSSRAVGNAVGSNPISVIIPCHRVIRSMGTFGNYGGGHLRKQALIVWESAQSEAAGSAP